jgi:DNA-binding transcriptional MerR regulator
MPGIVSYNLKEKGGTVKMERKVSFTKKEVSAALEISAGTVEFYTDEGLLIPEIANPSGRGKTRKYSRKNLLEILLIRQLASFGFSLAIIKLIMGKARQRGIAKMLDPEGEWGQNRKAKLIIYGVGSDDLALEMVGKDTVNLKMDRYDGATVVNIEKLFIKIDEI